ncbi:unnamed protein product [Cladocopium goreaui]|uniref:Uncharacterized protein n=1 Tax=Cladocopium goreaui TaxID=2562237 RepID=A0A9P1GM69_9DINO|nr:unnamed protein product [Cladocopium goreaui]
MTSWEHQVHSPNGHFWSLPVLLRAAARGKPSGCDDELNTDNEQELLQRGRASKQKIRDSKEINTDNEQDLLRRKDFRPSAQEVRQPEQKLWQSRGSFEDSGPSESLGELVHFAEGLCRDHIAVGRRHDRLGSVLASRAASEPSASGETSAEDSVDEDLEESADGSIRGPSNHGGLQVDTTINQQALASGGANSHVDEVDTEQVSPSDTWVDEPEQVAFSNSVGQSEIPAISPTEEATRSNIEVQVCLDSFRSETVSEISGDLDLCCLRRADCRFTQPGPWFCGMQGATHTDFEWKDTLEVCGRERLCLRQISEAVDDSLHALWHGSPAPAARERERASDAIPALLANLSGQLRIYHFQLKEKRCVECMDGSVVLLELLSRLVEVLDALAPAESTVGAASPALAVPCFRELVCDALNEALGLRGFLPLCISYVNGSPLEELDGSDLTLEMSFHALMAIQLCLLWFPPTRVALPEETFIDSGGYQAVLTLAADIVADLEDAEPGTEFLGLERLGLAMDILRLGMRSNVGIDYVCGNTGDTAEAPPVAPLAIRALEALSRAAGSCHSSGSGAFQQVAIATLPSAVRFVGALLHLTPIARFMSLAHVVHALRAALQCRPLSLPLTAAFRDLVRRERSRHWFSQGKEAAQLRGEFYRSLDGENVLNELALAATERVEELMESLQKKRGEGGQSYVACKSRGMKDVAVESLEEAVVIGNYYDNVEAAVVAVYGKTSRVEEMAELQELRSSLRPTAPAGALETMRRHLERCFPLPRASTQE